MSRTTFNPDITDDFEVDGDYHQDPMDHLVQQLAASKPDLDTEIEAERKQLRLRLKTRFGIVISDSELFNCLFDIYKMIDSSTPKMDVLYPFVLRAIYLQDTRRLDYAMIGVGLLLTVVGSLMIAASLGVAATGILAPLAAPGLAAAIIVTALGVGLIGAGCGLFALRRHDINKLTDNAEKIIGPKPA